MSILSFYLRFSIDNALRYTVYFVMLVTVGYTLPAALQALYVCQPMELYWDASVEGKCVNSDAVFHFANVLNVLTDFAILLMPIWILRPLKAPRLKKLGVTLILMTGGL